MELRAHPPVARIGVRYEPGSDRRAAPPAEDWASVENTNTNESGFYEALATQYSFLFFDNLGLTANGGAEREAAATLLEGVDQALAEHNIPNPAKVGTLEKKTTPLMVGALSKTLRQCVAAYLSKHFDALFMSAFGGEDNRDSLYAMYTALHPDWRQKLRHTNEDGPKNVHKIPYAAGKDRLKSAALMFILQRVLRNKTRAEASRLEANIAAHVFRAFVYMYKGADKSDLELDRVYGPDAELFQTSQKLLRLAILSDGKGNYSYFLDPVAHTVSRDVVRPRADGDTTAAVRKAIEKRVSIIGGLTPLRLAQGAFEDHGPTVDNVAIVDLVRRGAVYLRPPNAAAGNARGGARAGAAAEEAAILKQRRAEWLKAATNEQAERAQRNRGTAMQSGYPQPRVLEEEDAKSDESKVWTWKELEHEERAHDRARALEKIKTYGIEHDDKRKARLKLQDKPKPWGVDSWWEHRNEFQDRGDESGPTKKYLAVANRMAAEVWHETHRMRQPPVYKRCIRSRDDDEVERLANRRAVVEKWMKGHMRPKLRNGETPTTEADRREADALRCQANESFMTTFTIYEHPNLKRVLELLDTPKRNALQGEYADFMAAERRLLMNVLKSVSGNANEDGLDNAYNADTASFATTEEHENVPATAPAPAPAATAPAAPAPAVWKPSDFKRLLISDGLVYMHGVSGQKPPLWAGGGGNYEPKKASELIEKAKGFKKKKEDGTLAESDKKTPIVGRIRRSKREPLVEQCNLAAYGKMPPQTEKEKYNAALVRLLELFDELQPQESNYLDKTEDPKREHWPHRNQFLQDDLVGRPEPYKPSSKKVNDTSTILTRLLQRYHKYGLEHPKVFQEDKFWNEFGDKFEKDPNTKFTAKAMETAFYSDLLLCFPKPKRDSDNGHERLNSIMQFVSWFYQHVWEEWTKAPRGFHSKLCRFVNAPDINSWDAPVKEKKADDKLWLLYNWEWTLKDRIKYRFDTLYKAVGFTKRALDFAVVDADSPLKATPELQAVLQKWMDMTTGKFGMVIPGANGAAMDMDVEEETVQVNMAMDTEEGNPWDGAVDDDSEDDKGNPWDGAVDDGSEEEEENAPSTSSRKISKHKSNIRKVMASSDEDDD